MRSSRGEWRWSGGRSAVAPLPMTPWVWYVGPRNTRKDAKYCGDSFRVFRVYGGLDLLREGGNRLRHIRHAQYLRQAQALRGAVALQTGAPWAVDWPSLGGARDCRGCGRGSPRDAENGRRDACATRELPPARGSSPKAVSALRSATALQTSPLQGDSRSGVFHGSARLR
jgi:hypothetical protein